MVKEVKHNEVEVECKECENGQQQQKLNSTKMEGEVEHSENSQKKTENGYVNDKIKNYSETQK